MYGMSCLLCCRKINYTIPENLIVISTVYLSLNLLNRQ